MDTATRTLPSWRDGAIRTAIIDFVEAAVGDGPGAIPAEERVAVFDNDGTLWAEKPMPGQLHFIVTQWAKMAAADPSLASRQPYSSVISGDFKWLGAAIDKHYAGDDSDLKILIEAVIASSSGVEVGAYAAEVRHFMESTLHPSLKRPYPETAYVPMVELLGYLRAHGFSVYITSGGDRDFMRPFTQSVYEIAPEQVIGSALGLEYRASDGGGSVVYGSRFDFMDDGDQKPIRIWSRTGRRPVFAFGNSNGDIPMLEFASGSPNYLSLLLRHDDAEREFAYDSGSEKALATADPCWRVVSMKDDFCTVFGPSAEH